MIALELLVAVGVIVVILWGIWHAFGAALVRHEKLIVGSSAIVFALVLVGLFVASLLFGGVSFTGSNLHPQPPPIPTDAPHL